MYTPDDGRSQAIPGKFHKYNAGAGIDAYSLNAQPLATIADAQEPEPELDITMKSLTKRSIFGRQGSRGESATKESQNGSYSPLKTNGINGTSISASPVADSIDNIMAPTPLTTALDHIIEMGVTTVQILPVQDFDNWEDTKDPNVYWWGYMPVHFNSPDGWFASDTATIARVTELKKLVSALHDAGLKVIMDVVYNHTAEDGNEFNLGARFSFNGLEPRYYYRNCGNTPLSVGGHNTCAFKGKDEKRCGTCYSNGSGCGNEFRSEAPMCRKFLLDSLKYWVNEYKVDGFRFDLLGLIDTETVVICAAELKKIDPNIMLYGEPWTGGPTPIAPTEKGTQRGKGFGVFNNTLRDALRVDHRLV